MHPVALLQLVLAGACMAHYRGYDMSRNLLPREEHAGAQGELVECPVCESPSWLPSHEECDVVQGNKKFKRCHRGTYVNEVCGNRLDCFRGPGEHCTEKMDYDVYGQKCAHGYYCDSTIHRCTGLGYTVDNHLRWLLNHVYLYPLPSQKEEQSGNAAMLLA